MMPWAIVATVVHMAQAEAWKFYSIIFGGALVFDFFNVSIVLLIWVRQLTRGKVRLGSVQERI